MSEKVSSQLNIDSSEVKSLRDIAHKKLKDAIITGYLKPGEPLIERELSRTMGISTTPIKEAIRILNYEGLVISKPRKGNYVSNLVDSTIKEVLLLRAEIEGFAAKLATMKMTNEDIKLLEKDVLLMKEISKDRDMKELIKVNSDFHNRIRGATENPFIYNMLITLSSFDSAFRERALFYNHEKELGIKEHYSIYEAIKSRNPDLAEQRTKNHIQRTANNVLQKVNKN